MKQLDFPAGPPQTARRSAPDASKGIASHNRPPACDALQSAEIVVVSAARKKDGARSDAGGAQAKPGMRSAPEQAIGLSNKDIAGAGTAVSAHTDLICAVSKRLHERCLRRDGADQVGGAAVDMRGAVAFDASGKGKHDDEIDRLREADPQPPPANPAIPGVDDRIPYMALTAGAAMPVLRPPKMAPPPLINRLRPKSRAECQRRCGPGGFCDPSSELGCGGMHCGRPLQRIGG